MYCDFSTMATPVVVTSDLGELLAYYTGVLRFRVVQEVRHVLALVESGSLRLQLWQRGDGSARVCRIPLDGRSSDIFRLHSKLARTARSAMVEPGPMLQRWGAWEFSMFDCHGNRLIFSQRADA
jgi:hypothetical protein